MLKHDIENSSVTITRLSKSIAPAIQQMVDFIKSERAYHIVNDKQLKIIERAMYTISEEAEHLTSLVKKVINLYEGNSNDK